MDELELEDIADERRLRDEIMAVCKMEYAHYKEVAPKYFPEDFIIIFKGDELPEGNVIQIDYETLKIIMAGYSVIADDEDSLEKMKHAAQNYILNTMVEAYYKLHHGVKPSLNDILSIYYNILLIEHVGEERMLEIRKCVAKKIIEKREAILNEDMGI